MHTKILAAGGLVQNDKGELLMIFRRGKWDLPKGKQDPGETTETCAVREVEEETGLRNIHLGELVMITHHQYFDKHSAHEVSKETYWYRMKISGEQELVPQAEEDITAIRWVRGTALKECLKNSYRNIVEVVHHWKKKAN